MRRTPSLRRGNCLFMTLVGLAVIGLLLLVGGTIAFFVSNPTKAIQDAANSVQAFAANSTALEAPGTFEVELKAGGAGFILSPDGEVEDKVIPTPPANVTYTFTVTDADGTSIKIEPNQAPRRGNEPFYFFGFCEIPADGIYTIEVQASDGTTPAAILATPATAAEIEELGKAAGAAAIGGAGGCGAICGLVLLLVGGIGALFARKKSQQDPLAA